MGCRVFEENIQPFIDGSFPDDIYDEFIEHYNTCSECREELEILYLVHYALHSIDLDSSSLDLRDKLKKHMDNMKEQVYLRYKYRFLKNVTIGAAQFVTLVGFVGYLLYLIGIF